MSTAHVDGEDRVALNNYEKEAAKDESEAESFGKQVDKMNDEVDADEKAAAQEAKKDSRPVNNSPVKAKKRAKGKMI
jgi:hypothetical protein